MKVHSFRSIVFSFILIAVTTADSLCASPPPEDPEGRALIQQAHRAIAEYHAGQPKSSAVLRVVYFHPSDRDPLPNYAERLDRVLNDVSNFYRDGLRRFGLENSGLPLERNDGRLVLHVVRGKFPARDYNGDSGAQTMEEIRASLHATINLDHEHVLVIYALGRKEPDGRYVFSCPYWGSGSQRNGIAHATDCELLDPQLLSETKNKILFADSWDARMLRSVAEFNTLYIGGIAHELGHGLGLQHDAGSFAEERFGTSLMGSGNRHYRSGVWGGKAPAYLSRESVLQLAAHPFFTGSDRGREESPGVGFADLTFTASSKVLEIHGRLERDVEPYAVVARIWPARFKEIENHSARTFPATVHEGEFTLRLEGLQPDTYTMNLSILHVNGATTTQRFRFGYDAARRPDAASLGAAWTAGFIERAEAAVLTGQAAARRRLSLEATPHDMPAEERKKLQVLREVLDPGAPLELASVSSDHVFLSDVKWTDARVGWGQMARNHTWFDRDNQNGVFLMVGGRFHDKGLYAHSASRYVFDLGGQWKTFTATIGIRDGAHEQGSAVFTVRGDGRELYRSRILRVGKTAEVKVSIANVSELELVAEGGEGHVHNSWAIWAEPQVSR